MVAENHLKGLKALREEGLVENFVVVSQDSEPRKFSCSSFGVES
jgi:hypothetical protein